MVLQLEVTVRQEELAELGVAQQAILICVVAHEDQSGLVLKNAVVRELCEVQKIKDEFLRSYVTSLSLIKDLESLEQIEVLLLRELTLHLLNLLLDEHLVLQMLCELLHHQEGRRPVVPLMLKDDR